MVNVGDSRTYLCTDGELRQLTRDHSYVEEMVAAGQITADEARRHPQRNIVTRASASSRGRGRHVARHAGAGRPLPDLQRRPGRRGRRRGHRPHPHRPRRTRRRRPTRSSRRPTRPAAATTSASSSSTSLDARTATAARTTSCRRPTEADADHRAARRLAPPRPGPRLRRSRTTRHRRRRPPAVPATREHRPSRRHHRSASGASSPAAPSCSRASSSGVFVVAFVVIAAYGRHGYFVGFDGRRGRRLPGPARWRALVRAHGRAVSDASREPSSRPSSRAGSPATRPSTRAWRPRRYVEQLADEPAGAGRRHDHDDGRRTVDHGASPTTSTRARRPSRRDRRRSDARPSSA